MRFTFEWEAGSYGYIDDNANSYQDLDATTSGALRIVIEGIDEPVNIMAGDSITLYYDSTSKTIYFPRLTSDTTLYVAADGAAYTDANLCNAAYIMPI